MTTAPAAPGRAAAVETGVDHAEDAYALMRRCAAFDDRLEAQPRKRRRMTMDTYIDKRLWQRLDEDDPALVTLATDALACADHLSDLRAGRPGFLDLSPDPIGAWRAYLDAERRHPRERTAPQVVVWQDFDPYGGAR